MRVREGGEESSGWEGVGMEDVGGGEEKRWRGRGQGERGGTWGEGGGGQRKEQ